MGIIRFSCPVLSINEALLRDIRDRVPKRTIVVKTSEKPWFDDRCVLAHLGSKEYIDCRAVVRRKLSGRSIGSHVVLLSWSINMLNEHLLNGANYFCRMH